MIETVASIGAHVAVADGGETTVVGVSNTTGFFRPVREGRLVAAQPVHQGRTRQVWEVRITRAGDGKLVSRGQVRLQHVARRQT